MKAALFLLLIIGFSISFSASNFAHAETAFSSKYCAGDAYDAELEHCASGYLCRREQDQPVIGDQSNGWTYKFSEKTDEGYMTNYFKVVTCALKDNNTAEPDCSCNDVRLVPKGR